MDQRKPIEFFFHSLPFFSLLSPLRISFIRIKFTRNDMRLIYDLKLFPHEMTR